MIHFDSESGLLSLQSQFWLLCMSISVNSEERRFCSRLQCSCSFSCFIVSVVMATKIRYSNGVGNPSQKMPTSWFDLSLEYNGQRYNDKALPVQKLLRAVYIGLVGLCHIFNAPSNYLDVFLSFKRTFTEVISFLMVKHPLIRIWLNIEIISGI